MNERVLFADRAGLRRGPAVLRRRPNQFRVSITHVDLGQPALAIVRNESAALQAIVDNAACLRAAIDCRRSKRHDTRPSIRPAWVVFAGSRSAVLIAGKGSEDRAVTRLALEESLHRSVAAI